jgi:hypothetical protein
LLLVIYETYEAAKKIMGTMATDQNAKPMFSLDGESIRRIWLGNNQALQLKLFSVFHESALGGH